MLRFVFLFFIICYVLSQDAYSYIKCNVRIGNFGGDPWVVGVSPDFSPFEFFKGSELKGFDVDVVLSIAKHAGRDIFFKCLPFSSVMTLLSNGKLDMAISAINITEKRMQNKTLSFSVPYYISNFGVIFNNFNIKWGDTARVAVQKGTAMETFLYDFYKVANILTFSSNSLAVQALKFGLVDFVLLELEQAKKYAKINKKFSFSVVNGGNGGYVFAFSFGSSLVSVVNNAIRDLSIDNGVMHSLYIKWFGDSVDDTNRGFAYYIDTIRYIFSGVWVTLFYGLFGVCGGLLLGFFLALVIVFSPKIIQWFVFFYISLFRGTPLLLQLSIIYFTLPSIVGSIPVWVAGILSLSLNSAAYIANIVYGGIKDFDSGQLEAANSLNLSILQKYRDIILPQVLKSIAPSLINEIIDLVKESAIISVIGGGEIMYRANSASIESYSYFFPLVVAGIFYYILSILVLCLIKSIKKRFG